MQAKVKKPKGRLSLAERSAIATLAGNGVSVSQIAKDLGRCRQAVTEAIAEAKELLGTNAKFYAEQHLKATAIAALDGNSKPAEWALERLKVVDPVKDQQNQGFTVQIGVLLPGLGSDATRVAHMGKTGQVIEAEVDSAT